MLVSTIREITAEEEEVHLHLETMESLVNRYSKRVSESLEERIKRAHTGWLQLSPEECAVRHEQETRQLKSLFKTLQHELNRTKRKLASLKQAKKRAHRILAEEVSPQNNSPERDLSMMSDSKRSV